MKSIAPLALILLLGACASEGPLTAISPKPATAVDPKPAADASGTAVPAAPPVETAALAPVLAPGAETPAPRETAAATATPAPVVKPKPPAATARTVEEFDTTTQAERTAAVKPAPAPAVGSGKLGTTVASLGAAGEPGFWIKTPLVKQRTAGRLFYAASGRNVQVQLIPSGGSSGSGSQVSLAAMRLLDAPLDGLPEVVVYAN